MSTKQWQDAQQRVSMAHEHIERAESSLAIGMPFHAIGAVIQALREVLNTLDAAGPGQSQPGERNGAHKLTAEQVGQIRLMLVDGFQQKAIAQQFGVHPKTIWDIKQGKHWGTVGLPSPCRDV